MKLVKAELLKELQAKTETIISFSENTLLKLPPEALNFKSEAKKWNINECLEHVNLYGNYYLIRLEKALKEADFSSKEAFNSGMLGNYFANSMLITNPGKVNAMNTFKDKNPILTGVRKDVLKDFIRQQYQFLNLVRNARDKDLERPKIPITISRFIKLKLGDTLRFTIYHNERHIFQVQEVLNQYNTNSSKTKKFMENK